MIQFKAVERIDAATWMGLQYNDRLHLNSTFCNTPQRKPSEIETLLPLQGAGRNREAERTVTSGDTLRSLSQRPLAIPVPCLPSVTRQEGAHSVPFVPRTLSLSGWEA